MYRLTDYYAFGLEIQQLSYTRPKAGAYRFGLRGCGFNGQEKSEELGSGMLTAKFWQYDAKIGRRWNVDPANISQPSWSPYKTFYDNPILWIDPTGAVEEFDSYSDYKKALGDKAMAEDKWDGSDGHWLTSDRKNNTERWNKANWSNVLNQRENQYKPFEQVRDFYKWARKRISEQGHESRWAMGAHLLVDELLTLDWLGAAMDDDVEQILGELNIGIANYAIIKFHELLVDRGTDAPLQGEEAQNWDYEFIKYEQGVVAKPIYAKYMKDSPATIEKMQAIAEKKLSWGAPLGGIGAMFTSQIPAFTASVTDALYRIELPMKKLYPFRFKATHPKILKMEMSEFTEIKHPKY